MAQTKKTTQGKKPAPKKTPVKKAAKGKLTKMPPPKQLEKMRAEDEGFCHALEDSVAFLETRRQAVFNIARNYHLDAEELFQEAYEVLLTCLRDYSPVYEKADGSVVSVLFTTFFGNRIESRAMEMRNENPEYQARQAYTEKMDDGERARFKQDPPLLVQHLDHESPMQESLTGEASFAREGQSVDVGHKIMRDSFFEAKLNELVAKETDEKKKAALLHVKVGGVYNFQEMAYHFGVTDSRASQVLNELMDAFYIQRMIDQDVVSVARDFEKLKFNEKRIARLVNEAMSHANAPRAEELIATFTPLLPDLKKEYQALQKKQAEQEKKAISAPKEKRMTHSKPAAYEDVLTDAENKKYPLESVELRSIQGLHSLDMAFRPPESEEEFREFVDGLEWVDDTLQPAIVTQNGAIIDGERRIRAAQMKGRSDYMCIVRKVPNELDARLLRVMINYRLQKPSKIDLYYAISALADLGLSQQRIADCIGTSRTNVLVYVKVRDKASAKLRALFEDGLIQVTNASTCVDLDEPTQDRLAQFIRRHGAPWSKGAKFNKLHLAATQGKMDAFEKEVGPAPEQHETTHEKVELAQAGVGTSNKAVQALSQRIETYEMALKDAEIWASRREGVISTQTELLEQAQAEIERLKKEVDAAELMKFGSPDVIEAELKELRKFYLVTERLSGAAHALSQASREMKRMDMRRKQTLELADLMEQIEQKLNAMRLELLNRTSYTREEFKK